MTPALLPAWIVVLEELPLTAHGKLDRHRLTAPQVEADNGIAPRTEFEVLTEAYAEVLELPSSVDESFFALGGHSVIAIRLASRIQSACGIEMPLRTLFENPSVVGLARNSRDGCTGEERLVPEVTPIP